MVFFLKLFLLPLQAQKLKEAHSTARFNQLLTEKIHQKEKNLEQKYWETHQNFLKKEKKYQEQIYNQTHELAELKRERGERDGEVEELRGEKEEREREWRGEVSVLREEVERERGKGRELKAELERLEEVVEEGKSKGGEWKREKKKLVGKVGEAKEELENLEKRVGKERGEWVKEKSRLEKEVEELRVKEREQEAGGGDSIALRGELKVSPISIFFFWPLLLPCLFVYYFSPQILISILPLYRQKNRSFRHKKANSRPKNKNSIIWFTLLYIYHTTTHTTHFFFFFDFLFR